MYGRFYTFNGEIELRIIVRATMFLAYKIIMAIKNITVTNEYAFGC